MQTQIIKQVTESGNGGHVITPKEWIGHKVIVVLPEVNIKQGILERILPHLPHIRGVYLYGSYARGEETPDSDIDILIVADKEKIPIEKKPNYEINITTEENIRKTMKNNPLLIYPILLEAKPILNEELLKKLLEEKVTKRYGWYIQTTNSALKIIKNLLKGLEKTDKAPDSVIYSLMMRLRGLYLIECLRGNKKYTNKDLKKILTKKEIPNWEEMYKVYRAVRDNKPAPKYSIDIMDIQKLYLLVDEMNRKAAK